ncbi:MAG: twin-arginine translocation signal domain-containing protein [bacterium]
MKRITPAKQQPEPDYPTAEEAGVNRRGFLQVLVASGAAAAGAVVLGSDPAHARGIVARPRYRIAIDLKPPVTYTGCKSAIVQVVARTYIDEMDAFLRNAKERKGVLAVIRAELRKYKCSDVVSRGLYRVQSNVSGVLRKHYERRTGKSSGTVWIKLVFKSSS